MSAQVPAPRTGCPAHNPIQHRDARPAWCRACGRTADGSRPIRPGEGLTAHDRAVVRAAHDAVRVHVWNPDRPLSAHIAHVVDSECAVCNGDLDAVLRVALPALRAKPAAATR